MDYFYTIAELFFFIYRITQKIKEDNVILITFVIGNFMYCQTGVNTHLVINNYILYCFYAIGNPYQFSVNNKCMIINYTHIVPIIVLYIIYNSDRPTCSNILTAVSVVVYVIIISLSIFAIKKNPYKIRFRRMIIFITFLLLFPKCKKYNILYIIMFVHDKRSV